MNRGLHFYTAGRTQRKTNPLTRHLSCEVEIAESDGNSIEFVAKRWQCSIVEDRSLPAIGFEVTTSPASGDLFVTQIEDLCAALADDGADVDRSCGLHVHVDARDFRYWDIRRLILLYAKIEDALFQLVPLSRRNSYSCVRCGAEYIDAIGLRSRPREAKRGLMESLYGSQEGTRAAKGDKYHSCRYRALNLHSWFFRGTVEIRLAAGSTDAEKITNWAILCGAIVDYAARHSDREVTTLAGSSMEILRSLAPTAAIRDWIDARRAKLNPAPAGL